MKGRISLLILLVVILVTLTSCGSGTKKGSRELQQLREQVKTLQEENSELQKENKELKDTVQWMHDLIWKMVKERESVKES